MESVRWASCPVFAFHVTKAIKMRHHARFCSSSRNRMQRTHWKEAGWPQSRPGRSGVSPAGRYVDRASRVLDPELSLLDASVPRGPWSNLAAIFLLLVWDSNMNQRMSEICHESEWHSWSGYVNMSANSNSRRRLAATTLCNVLKCPEWRLIKHRQGLRQGRKLKTTRIRTATMSYRAEVGGGGGHCNYNSQHVRRKKLQYRNIFFGTLLTAKAQRTVTYVCRITGVWRSYEYHNQPSLMKRLLTIFN
jgi:hypothetical protein